jgi:DNA-binding NarL/FixJ family response regulator
MIRLLLVDDQNLICQGLKAVLNQESDLEVVGTAENGEVALRLAQALQPHIVLMDIRMPVMNGIEATRLMHQRFPAIKVLALSTFDDDLDIAQSMRAGAKGYLLKDTPTIELVEAIRLVDRGYSQMGPGLMEKLVTQVPDIVAPDAINSAIITQLPQREQEVLQLIAKGYTNREIGLQLNLAEGTVKTYVSHLLNRLTLRNRSQLAIYANSIAFVHHVEK